MAKARSQVPADDEAPIHPAAHLGSRAVKLFDEIVEQTSLRKRGGKTIELLVDNGLVYDRHAGWDEYGFEIFDVSARLEAWDLYSSYLDHQEKVDARFIEEPAIDIDDVEEPAGPSF